MKLAETFGAMPWNHIMDTGGSEIAKKIAVVAAKNLIPLTLELGGKNPTIVAEDSVNAETIHKILGTVCVTADSVLVMQHEIFGPILPIKAYTTIEKVIQYVNGHERPLATYVFTSNAKIADQVLKNIISAAFQTKEGGITQPFSAAANKPGRKPHPQTLTKIAVGAFLYLRNPHT